MPSENASPARHVLDRARGVLAVGLARLLGVRRRLAGLRWRRRRRRLRGARRRARLVGFVPLHGRCYVREGSLVYLLRRATFGRTPLRVRTRWNTGREQRRLRW